MDGFELNKILMAIILALLLAMVASKISNILIDPEPLYKNAYNIDNEDVSPALANSNSTADNLEAIEPLLAHASIEEGQKIARKCLQCHTLNKGGLDKIGPNLWGIVEAKFAHRDSFAYSNDLKNKNGNWTYANLNAFIHKPRAFISGTKMSFIGIKDTKERANLIAYLRTLSDNPVALPLNSNSSINNLTTNNLSIGGT